MRPEHLDLLEQCGTPTVHPDDSLAIVSVIRPDLHSNEYVGGLWSVPLDNSGSPRRLTRGHRDTDPAISPDGRLVAFLRAKKMDKPQMYVVEVGGGEPVVLTDAPLGAGAPRWSPDSRRIAYAARVPEQGRYGTDEDIAADAEAPRLISKLAYRADSVGFTNDRRNHLFVLDVPDLDALDTLDPAEPHPKPGGFDVNRQEQDEDAKNAKGTKERDAGGKADLPEARQITDGECDDVDVSWGPDGSRLAFVSDRDADGSPTQREDLTSSVFTCAYDGSELVLAAHGQLSCNGPQWTLDGQRIVFLAEELGEHGIPFVARNRGLWVVPFSASSGDGADGSAVPSRLTDAETIDLGEVGSHLSVSERGVLVQDRRRGTVRLLEIDPSAGPVDAESAVEIAGGRAWHRGHAVTRCGATVVAAVSDTDRPAELVLVRGPSEDLPHRLTDVSRRLRETAPPRQPIEQEVTGADGYPVHGWAVLPDPDQYGSGPYPVLLNIHGGPYASYVGSFFDEPQVYAGAGYAVLMCNPRGSAGYGQAHGLAIKAAMGSVDTDDILAFLEGCLADPALPLDGDRVGVMGGSYGGYMTAWLTTRTDRFRAAIVERGYLDAVSYVGSSDIGWFFPDEYHRRGDGREVGRPAASDDPDAELREQSPMAYVDRVSTPTLVIHSEADWRTPIEQGQRWFVALRRNGVPAQLLIFPGEGHEMSRSGKPTHRRDRFTHILSWWAEHLTVKRPN